MGIYTGVNGVARKVSQVPAGVNGAVRSVRQGFYGSGNIRRQFFGPLEDVVRIEAHMVSCTIYSIDSSGNITEIQNGASLSDLNRYGSAYISGTQIQIRCNTIGKDLYLWGYFYAVFENGRKVEISHLSDYFAKYGATISFPIAYSIYIGHSASSWQCDSVYRCNCCDVQLNNGSFVNGSASGTKTLSLLSGSSGIEISSGVKSGYGGIYQNVSMNFASGITIDGRNVPAQIINELK